MLLEEMMRKEYKSGHDDGVIEGLERGRSEGLERGRSEGLEQGLCEEIDREVIRVIQNAPALWTPGKLAGKPVKCHVEMPVVFKLRK